MADIKLYEQNGEVLDFTFTGEKLEGKLSLAQLVIKLLLDSPNNMLSTGSEGNLLNTAGRDRLQRGTLQIELSEKVSKVEDFIKEEQRGKELSLQEQLSEIKINEINISSPPTEAELVLEIENSIGDSIVASTPVGGN